MNWTGWLILGLALLGVYLLGLVGYRLLLSVRSLRDQVARANSLIEQAQQLEELAIVPASPVGQSDLAKVLLNRRHIQSEKQNRREARQRRLVQRISEIQIDKR